MSWISLGPLGFPLNTRGRDVRFSRSWNISHSSSGTSFHFSLLFSIPPTLPPALSFSLSLLLSLWSHDLILFPGIRWLFEIPSTPALDWTRVTAQLIPKRLRNENVRGGRGGGGGGPREKEGTGEQPSARNVTSSFLNAGSLGLVPN